MCGTPKLNLSLVHPTSVNDVNKMKKTLKNQLCLTVVLLLLAACGARENDKAKIIITSTQARADILITRIHTLKSDTLLTSKTDSVGSCTFEIPVTKPMFVIIQIGKKYGEVYLSPGDDLVINENGEAYQIPLTFSGQGAEINNYVSWVNSTVEKIKWSNGRGTIDLEIPEFLNLFDSLKTVVNTFHKHYIDSVALPHEVVSLLEKKEPCQIFNH